jgi:hypothetical protein
MRRIASGCVVAVLVAACFREVAGPGGLRPQLSKVGDGEVRADLVLRAIGSEHYHLTVFVRGDHSVAAYQGSLKFNPELVSVTSQSAPATDVHLVNADAGPGVVKFAAFGVSRLADSVAFELDVVSRRALQVGDLTVTLDVVGTAEGGRFTPNQIRAGQVALVAGDR